jgi:twitching motility protein PilT
VSSPEDFTLPLSDAPDRRDAPAPLPTQPPGSGERPSLPTAPSIPLAPPSVDVVESIPLAPPVTIPVTAPPAEDDDVVDPGEDGTVGRPRPGGSMDEVLRHLMERGGSDLHLSANSPPMIRVHGELEAVPGYGALSAQQLQQSIYSILTAQQQQRFEETKELDLSYEIARTGRFRVNLLRQRGAISAAVRAVPWQVPSLDALNMPAVLADCSDLPRGLVLVTGPAGSGKSTTLAAIIDRANRTRRGHIITIEEPIEFVHKHRQCVVNQREVGQDTLSFEAALTHALRQDPDIILVGELNDLDIISMALTAVESGRLVLGTLTTGSAATTIDRIIDAFPPSQQQRMRTQLATSVEAIVCQTLCRTADGTGSVAATEVMVATPAVRNLIREGKVQSIPSALQTGSRFGMHTLNQDLATLVQNGRITYEVAREKASDLAELNQLLGKAADAAD